MMFFVIIYVKLDLSVLFIKNKSQDDIESNNYTLLLKPEFVLVG